MPAVQVSFFTGTGGGNDDSVGVAYWTNPENAADEDGIYASADVGEGEDTVYLTVTGFAPGIQGVIPASARIRGVVMAVLPGSVAGEFHASDVRLFTGNLFSENRATPGNITSSDEDSYGGSADTWGLPLTAAMLRSGVSALFSAACTTAPGTATIEIDYVYLVVYWQANAGGFRSRSRAFGRGR